MRNEVIWTRRYTETGTRLDGIYERPAFTISKVITQNRFGKSQGPVYTVEQHGHLRRDYYPTLGGSNDHIFFTFQAAKAHGIEMVHSASSIEDLT